jgi:hypothetical protein
MERWGTLSVKDHLDARALATEVLLYDSLVFPRPTQDDFQRWVNKKWEPDKLYKTRKAGEGRRSHSAMASSAATLKSSPPRIPPTA